MVSDNIVIEPYQELNLVSSSQEEHSKPAKTRLLEVFYNHQIYDILSSKIRILYLDSLTEVLTVRKLVKPKVLHRHLHDSVVLDKQTPGDMILSMQIETHVESLTQC